LRAAIQRGRPALITNLLTRDLSKVQTHSSPDSDVSSRQRSFPVVIMRAGASAEVANYSTLAEDLASHGYIVVGFDAPYRTGRVVFPDGRVIARSPENDPELCSGGKRQEPCANRLLAGWSADIAFVLDRLGQLNLSDSSGRFTGRLDMTHIGVFGHSFGGATAALFCHEDSRCKAGLDIDGAPHGSVIQAGIDRPFMSLLTSNRFMTACLRMDGSASRSAARTILPLATMEPCSRALSCVDCYAYSVVSVSTGVVRLRSRHTVCTAFSTLILRKAPSRPSKCILRLTRRSKFSLSDDKSSFIVGCREMTLQVWTEKPEGEFPRLRSSANIAVALGAAGSIGLLLRAGQRTPRLLLVLMAIWVLSPFIALIWASLVSKHWSRPTRAALYTFTL
jgi:pimeloyl-ACP methyl ester carboxylesterase